MAMMRSAYRLVKIAPFAYSVIYIVGIGIYAFCGEDMSDFIGGRNSHSEPSRSAVVGNKTNKTT